MNSAQKTKLEMLTLGSNYSYKKKHHGAFDKELLEYTGQLLAVNPDIYTLWNIRREVLQALSKEDRDLTEISKTYNDELLLTECCLKVNPKSYCAWHHREWVLTTRSDPDWMKELSLCNIYLKYDERNFHVWDYRRFIVSHYKTPLEDEFKYTTEKIQENFSNYSAWHYRSKMLVQLYPDNEGGRPIADFQHKNELEIVQNAAFTDPDDTSAWFYQRWLLGAVKKVVQIVVCSVTPEITTVAFNSSLSKEHVSTSTQLHFNNTVVDGKWKSTTGMQYDYVWTYIHAQDIVEDINVKVEYNRNTSDKQILYLERKQRDKFVGKCDFSFHNQYSDPVIEELKKQLESCYQLLELEPDSKWTLLTTTVLMHCCDPKINQGRTLQNLMQLKQIDKLRSGYYDDLASKWMLEEYLETYGKDMDTIPPLHILYTFKLTALYHMQYFSSCIAVDLSNQHLTSRILPYLSALQNCKVLNLENNLITNLKNFPNLPLLQKIILKGNVIADSELEEFSQKYKNEINII